LRFLFLDPFHGGSHRDFACGWSSRSRHEINLVTLPPRFWKWRMRGAALHFSRRVADPGSHAGLITTDLIGLADLKALWEPACPPALVYFHENQLSYPLSPGEEPDHQFGFTNITTALAARRVLFNSRTHREAFLARLPGFLKMMPEHRPMWAVEAIRGRSEVLHPGCDFPGGAPDLAPPERDRPPLIVWNHRWEFDKRPEDFFAALEAVDRRGAPFRLALLGESFQAVRREFVAARERYGGRIEQFGYVESRRAYLEWLRRGAIVVSTAEQENFGLSVVEAIRFGCRPLLPNRLAYPELLPPEFHAACLYEDRDDLAARLHALLTRPAEIAGPREALAAAMGRYAWENAIGRFDAELDSLAASAAAPRRGDQTGGRLFSP
jgi:glycosyltransferase involved in cell wall biosynthesis